MHTDRSEWAAPIARWSVWEANLYEDGSETSPDVSFVEPMLRRRLSLLSKMSLRVAYDCAHDVPDIRFVYASRHGELTRTTAMLEHLAMDEGVSPTTFSMSVLNTSAGLFSILQRNAAPSTAISAAAASFGNGLLEASLQLADNPEQPVLLVYADEPIPVVYGETEMSKHKPHAIALLLQRGASKQLTCCKLSSNHMSSSEAQSRAFLRCLNNGQSIWYGEGNSWTWSMSSE